MIAPKIAPRNWPTNKLNYNFWGMDVHVGICFNTFPSSISFLSDPLEAAASVEDNAELEKVLLHTKLL